ncbi:hypothetical protein Lgra_1431 [Legionella gratiana]|uniref:Phenylacetate-CoA ligase n=1 Tax=Legionella gratiana TaxID=45066 RepID=A0A378JF04_9GAMM|nr:hypothetical protein [Legionella gratiana]KTD11973.1 hypothetical protein Lgra_1431 [Legionella gratiana]STX46423.1 phenylacetate-CoA ligase [Legionella gratiana]
MPVYSIESPVVLFNHDQYGTRLLFQQGEANPRNQLGKNGVTVHHWFSALFYKTITIEATLIDTQGRHQNQRFIINKSSLIKYIGSSASNADSDEVLIRKLHEKMYHSSLNRPTEQDKLRQKQAGDHLRHAGEYNHIKMKYSLWDNLVGKFLSWLFQKTLASFNFFKARFLIVRTEKNLFEAGEVLAKTRFHEAYTAVPAYKHHITRFQGKPVDHTTLRDIPITTKDNYIKYQKFDADTHFYGKYPVFAKVDTSTGTTGKPTAWVRGERELNSVKKTLELAEKAQFGNRRVAFINAFALGPWATGLTAYELMRNTGSVFATGADKEKILDELLRIKHYETHQLELEIAQLCEKNPSSTPEDILVISKFVDNSLKNALKHRHTSFDAILAQQISSLDKKEKHLIERYKSHIVAIAKKLNQEKVQILLTGYPPFLKDLATYIRAKGHHLSDFSVIGIVGGQANSEAMRDSLIRDGFNHIYSSYGASDLDVNLGEETDDEIIIRKAIEQNPGLARELYGVNRGLPMIFHFDPMNTHIECDNQEENKDSLIFTCTRDDRSSPRIRYNLGDKGRVYAASDVQALLAKYGIFHQPRSPLPLMFIWGRDSTVVFNGANLAFTELERALTNIDTEGQILKKAFYSYQDREGNDQLEFWLELEEGVELFDKETMQCYAKKLISQLVNINQDFRYQIEHLSDGAALPMVRFFKRGQSPISEAEGHRKQVLVFQKENLPENYRFPEEDICRGVKVPMSRALLTAEQGETTDLAFQCL